MYYTHVTNRLAYCLYYINIQAFVDSEPIEFAWTEETKEDILLIDNYTAVHAGPVSWGGSRAMLQTYGWGYGATSDCAGSKGF